MAGLVGGLFAMVFGGLLIWQVGVLQGDAVGLSGPAATLKDTLMPITILLVVGVVGLGMFLGVAVAIFNNR